MPEVNPVSVVTIRLDAHPLPAPDPINVFPVYDNTVAVAPVAGFEMMAPLAILIFELRRIVLRSFIDIDCCCKETFVFNP